MAKPNLTDLMTARGWLPVDLASRAKVSAATVYRATCDGKVPRPLLLSAMAGALGVGEAVVREAILRGAKRKVRL